MIPEKQRLNEILSDNFSQTDKQLISDCRRGNSDAWNAVIERYQRLIYAIPRRAGLNDEQSADVFQEVFLTLFEKLDDIQEPEKIRAWIVTTTKYKTWAVIRGTKGIYSPVSSEEMEYEMSQLRDGSALADDALIELEEQHLIRTALNKLGDVCRQLLSMIFLRDPPASYAEAAKDLGVGQTNISPMRARCLKKLAELLN